MNNIEKKNTKSLFNDIIDEMVNDKKKEKEKKKNEPYNIAYNNIIERVVKFYNSEISMNNPIDASIVFEYMLWNGYLSKDKVYTFSSRKRKNNNINYGADIMCGKGVCLNNGVIMADLLSELGYESIPLACNVYTNNEKLNFPIKIHRNISSSEKYKFLYNFLNNKNVFRKLGNHAITLCKDGNKTLPIDATNLSFINTNESLIGNIPDTKVIYEYKEVSTSLVFGIERQKIIDLLKLSINSYPYKLKEMLDRYNVLIDLCDNKQDLFNDLYNANKDDIEIVSKTLTKK